MQPVKTVRGFMPRTLASRVPQYASKLRAAQRAHDRALEADAVLDHRPVPGVRQDLVNRAADARRVRERGLRRSRITRSADDRGLRGDQREHVAPVEAIIGEIAPQIIERAHLRVLEL